MTIHDTPTNATQLSLFPGLISKVESATGTPRATKKSIAKRTGTMSTISFTKMNPDQLSLLPVLVTKEASVTGISRVTKKFTAPAAAAHASALWALAGGPQPLQKLQHLAGTDGDEVLAALRQLGLDVPCYPIPMPDMQGQIVQCSVCTLTERDARHVKRWIKHAGGANA